MSDSDKKEKTTVANTGVFGNTHYDIQERDFLQRELLKKLDNDSIAKRPGPNGQNVHYIETWKAIELANLIFGFNGWSSSIMEISNDYIEQTQQGKFNCGVSAIIRVSLKDGSFHEDIGYGVSDNQKHRGAAFEQAKKTAVSDGLKRALRNFGNALGLTIYDRDHLKQISKPTLKKPPTSNQPKPTNPYFSQSFGSQSSTVVNTTQQHLESISSASDYSQVVVPNNQIKQENNESNLQIDDDLDLDGSAIPDSPQQQETVPTATPPVFQRPANQPIPNNTTPPPVFQRPSPNQAFKRPGNPEASPPNQPANKKNKQ